MMAAAAAPANARAASSVDKVGAAAHASAVAVLAAHAQVTTRTLPKRSPAGPNTICRTPYASANEVMTYDAIATVTLYSSAIRGSDGSVTRKEAALANAANDNAAIAAIGTVDEPVDPADSVEGGAAGSTSIRCIMRRPTSLTSRRESSTTRVESGGMFPRVL